MRVIRTSLHSACFLMCRAPGAPDDQHSSRRLIQIGNTLQIAQQFGPKSPPSDPQRVNRSRCPKSRYEHMPARTMKLKTSNKVLRIRARPRIPISSLPNHFPSHPIFLSPTPSSLSLQGRGATERAVGAEAAAAAKQPPAARGTERVAASVVSARPGRKPAAQGAVAAGRPATVFGRECAEGPSAGP